MATEAKQLSEQTVAFLEDIVNVNGASPINKFDMWAWKSPAASCGTVGCLIGTWLMVSERKRDDLVLRLGVHPNSSRKEEVPVLINAQGKIAASYMVAVQLFLGLDAPSTEFLFDPEKYEESLGEDCPISRDFAIARVRRFIAADGDIDAVREIEQKALDDES